jgi:hypothetical protein
VPSNGSELDTCYNRFKTPPGAGFSGLDSTFAPRQFSGSQLIDSSITMVNSSSARSRRHSSPDSPPLGTEIPFYFPRKRSSTPPIPAAPQLKPQRLPSITDPVRSSWRLSFAESNRGEQLRKLSEGKNIPLSLNLESLVEGPPPMSRWLLSQGLRSPSQAISSEDTTNMESLPTLNAENQDFGGVDGGKDSLTTLHLHEMGISERLASRGLQSSASSPQLSTVGSRTHFRGLSNPSVNSRATNRSRSRYMRNTSDSIPLSQSIPNSWGTVLPDDKPFQDGASSFYPSAANSIQPSPQSSRFNLFSLLAASKSRTELADFLKEGWSLPLKHPRTISSTSHENDEIVPKQPPPSPWPRHREVISDSSATPSLVIKHRCSTIDNDSIAVSETDSFRQREAEIGILKTRFASLESHQHPSTPISSRFREEFEIESHLAEDSLPKRRSTFATLARLASRSYDGPMDVVFGVPLALQQQPSIFTRGDLTPGQNLSISRHSSRHSKGGLTPVSALDDGGVSGMWSNALKLNAESTSKNAMANSRKKSRNNDKNRNYVGNDVKTKKFALKGLGWGTDKSDSEQSGKEADAEDDWEAELERTAKRAKAKSRNIVRKANNLPDKLFPASWARFPSHDREQRSFSAGAGDRVQVNDFATDGSEFLDNNKKTLREKLRKKLVNELDKRATSEVQHSAQSTRGRRSSMRTAGDLEYPELELLPLHNISLLSAQQIVEHVEEALQEDELVRKEQELDAIFGSPKKEPVTEDVESPLVAKPSKKKSRRKKNQVMQETACLVATTSDESKSLAESPGTENSVKKGPTARRGPVARKPGDEASPSKPKPGPKIAPPITMPARPTKRADIMDGGVDSKSQESAAANVFEPDDHFELSINDPGFYADCVSHVENPGAYSEDCGDSVDTPLKVSNKGKFRTWGGRDWVGFKHQAGERVASLGASTLRKSTDEAIFELEKMERKEMKNVLRVAKNAWGKD